VQGDGPTAELTFHALAGPTDEEVLDVARRTAERVVVIPSRRKHGRSLDGLAKEGDAEGDPALASCYGAAARAPAMRVVEKAPGRNDEHAAVVMGFNVHAGARIDGRDRKRVERVCRYLARPPIAQDRLEKLPDGKLRYEMKKAWRDGTRFVVFEPHDLIARF